ncbi:hypothetical protein BU23DRAFT_632072 [Bimuria novae-zelandiae CBS 107.79]|uniref:Uncharacterized protein n=1 Tax=Bimuria novae-zelandiae CBS 107.79 TaxID=1447943 RepID=A0A6A5UK02_9PLEO|nr:hypothetical protein BU23DRAFT_632072 [Bimuria novae-zelandiae CBS 107.79]
MSLNKPPILTSPNEVKLIIFNEVRGYGVFFFRNPKLDQPILAWIQRPACNSPGEQVVASKRIPMRMRSKKTTHLITPTLDRLIMQVTPMVNVVLEDRNYTNPFHNRVQEDDMEGRPLPASIPRPNNDLRSPDHSSAPKRSFSVDRAAEESVLDNADAETLFNGADMGSVLREADIESSPYPTADEIMEAMGPDIVWSDDGDDDFEMDLEPHNQASSSAPSDDWLYARLSPLSYSRRETLQSPFDGSASPHPGLSGSDFYSSNTYGNAYDADRP